MVDIKNRKWAYVAVVRDDGSGIGIAVAGDKGYYTTDWPSIEDHNRAERIVAELNKEIGLTDREAFEIVATTMG